MVDSIVAVNSLAVIIPGPELDIASFHTMIIAGFTRLSRQVMEDMLLIMVLPKSSVQQPQQGSHYQHKLVLDTLPYTC